MAEKKAVVLAGGGSRGAYQVGVWEALRELEYDYSIVTGTSVGSLNGALMATGDLKLCREMWEKITTDQILDFSIEGDISSEDIQKLALKEFLEKAVKDRSIDQSPLKALLEEVIDVDAVYASPVDFGLVTTSFPVLRPVYLFKDQIPREHFIDYLMASSALFPAMKPYRIGKEYYIDGGYQDTMPIRMAEERGATEVVAVNLKSFGVYKSAKDKNVKVRIISPKEDLGFALFFDANFARPNIRRGYLDTMKAFARYDGWFYTFEKGSFSTEEAAFESFCEEVGRKVVPSGKAGELFLQHITGAMVRRLIRSTSAKTVARGWLHPAAEIAGRIFALSPLEIYTEESFLTLLEEQFASSEELPDFVGQDLLDLWENLRGEDLLKVLRSLTDEKVICKFLLHQLRARLDGKALNAALPLALEVAPGPLIAALFFLFFRQ